MSPSSKIARLLPLVVLISSTASHGAAGESGPREIRWEPIPDAALAEIPFKPVDPKVLEHDHEKRGFVSVPLDYGRPSGRQIDIFYRLMPPRESTTGLGAPILVVMNGGPGVPSSSYRALGYKYDGSDEEDAFSELSRYFRILAVDQRGTGSSAPLDLDDPALSAEVVARYFDSDEHARDHARVIDAVVPERERFFILARSYGGEIGFQYMTLGDLRLPDGIVFSSAVLPHADALETFLLRRRRQRELNLELRTAVPEIVGKLARLRRHLESLDMDGATVNFLWPHLGRGPGWEAELDRRVDELLTLDTRQGIEAELDTGIRQSVNLLNYVLSSASLTPGYTDRTMTRETSRRVPFEDWMLDENWTLNQIGRDGTWREDFIAAVDRNPPPPTSFPPVEEIRRALGRVQALFTFGRTDAFLPQDLQLERARRFHVPGHRELRVLEGGHGAAFSAEGATVVRDWAYRILGAEPLLPGSTKPGSRKGG